MFTEPHIDLHNTPIIGIAGKARSGKDTTANFILAAAGGYIYSFADPIRSMLIPLGIDMRDPYWQQHKEKTIPALGVSPRRLMQTLGTEWGRNIIDQNIWLILAKQRFLQVGKGMIIPDVRFDNEADWVRANGGIIIHLKRRALEEVEAHASEGGVRKNEADLTIVNNGDLTDLQNIIKRVFGVN